MGKYNNQNSMKTFILLAVIAIFGFNSMAQNETKPYFAIANDRLNIFYAGIENPVTIAASVAPEKLRISWGGATATYSGNGRYNVSIPDSLVGKGVTITVSVETKRGKIQNLGSRFFRVKPLPEPEIFIGANINGGVHSKAALLANPFIIASTMGDFHYHLLWRVVSYNVTFIINGIVEPPIIVENNRFGEQIVNKITDAPAGTVIEFSDFKIQCNTFKGKINRDIEKMIVIRIR